MGMKSAAGSNLKKVTLELGGKSPNIVFADADLDEAIHWVNFGIYFNHGQACCAGSRIYVQEEIFGPVCTISKFKTKADVIKIGNNTTYGLAAAVHTSNLTTAIEVANALRAGTVWVNSYNTLHWSLPFGGYKESGIGRELGEAALENYIQTKTVSIRLGDVLFG